MNALCFGDEMSVRDVEELFFNQMKRVTQKSQSRRW
jgi:hypothetical protein